MEIRKDDFEALVNLSDQLDKEGHETEAAALDTVLHKIAEKMEKQAAQVEMSNKAHKACESLIRALESFCGKNLDTRGPNRRTLNKIIDTAEDLLTELKTLLGKKE